MIIERTKGLTSTPVETIESFAERHGLVMVVHERVMDGWLVARSALKFTARFKHAEIKDGGMLTSVTGEGWTEAAAIKDYARAISGKMLVIHAMNTIARQEIPVPALRVDQREGGR